MNRRQKIAFGVSIPIALVCAVLNIAGDYIQKNRFLEVLMAASFGTVIVSLAELAVKSGSKDKNSN